MDETDANTALLLEREIDKRVAAALVKILLQEVPSAEGLDSYAYLQRLIRQEIVDAFADNSQTCTRTVTTGDTIRILNGITVT